MTFIGVAAGGNRQVAAFTLAFGHIEFLLAFRSPLQPSLGAWRGKHPIEKANACWGCFVKGLVLSGGQHPACGEVAAAQNTRDTEVTARRRRFSYSQRNLEAQLRCASPLSDNTVCSSMCVRMPRVWSLTVLLLKRSNDGPGQNMFDGAPGDTERKKL